jgi:pimeloyl-ACP methyl ester carboxylesterase
MIKKLLKLLLALLAVAIIAFTIFWFSRPADLSFVPYRASYPNSSYSHFTDIGGVRVHYQERGNGTPLILIHGYTSSNYSWKDVFEPLSKTFRVISLDLKGFGFSGKPDGDYTRRAQAIFVMQLLDRLGIDKAWFAGSSMGGEVALNIAITNPQRVSGLILIDSAGLPVAGSGSLAPRYLLVPVVGRVLTAFALRSDKLVREGLSKSFYDDANVTADRVNAYYLPLQTRDGQLAALRARTQAGQFPVEAELPKLDVPTLILWGREDELNPLEAGRKFNALIKNSKLVVFDHCGHLPQEEMPARVVEEVNRFVNKDKSGL